MSADKRSKSSEPPHERSQNPMSGEPLDTESLGDFADASLGTEDIGYSVRPRTPAEEALVQATLETEDVVVLLPTDDLESAAALPEVEEVSAREPSIPRPDLQVRGAGLRSELGEASAAYGGARPTDAMDTGDFSSDPEAIESGRETEDAGWSWNASEALPELEDVEDITAMLPAEGAAYDLVSPSATMDPELVALGLGAESEEAQHRSWLPMLAVAALLVGAVYFGLDIYRDQLGRPDSGGEVAHATDPLSTDTPSDPVGAATTNPTDPTDPTDPAVLTDPVASTPTEAGTTPGTAIGVRKAPPGESGSATTNPPASAVDVREFRAWVGESLVQHLNPTLDRDN